MNKETLNESILSEDSKSSSMRVGMLLCIITACTVSIAAVVGSMMETPIDSNVPWLVGGLLSAGIGGKAYQKGVEKNKA